MFQAYFLTQVGRPQGSHPSTVLNHYNKSLGRPTARMVERLRIACGEIAEVSDWPGFFSRLGLPLPSQCQVATRLRNAVVNSAAKGYHGSRTDGRHGASRRQGERQLPRHNALRLRREQRLRRLPGRRKRRGSRRRRRRRRRARRLRTKLAARRLRTKTPAPRLRPKTRAWKLTMRIPTLRLRTMRPAPSLL